MKGPLSQFLQRRHEGGRFEAFVRCGVRGVFLRAAQPVRQARVSGQGKIAKNVAEEAGGGVVKAVAQADACFRAGVQQLPERGQGVRRGNKKEQHVRAEAVAEVSKVLNFPVRPGSGPVMEMIAVTKQRGSQQFLKAGIVATELHQFELIPDGQMTRGKGQIVHGGKAGDAHVGFHPFTDGDVAKAQEQQRKIFGQFRQGAENGVQIAALFQNIEQAEDFYVGAGIDVAGIV